MNSPLSHKGSDPTRLVWLLISISFVAGMVIVGIFWWSLNNIRLEREKLLSLRTTSDFIRSQLDSRFAQKQFEIVTILEASHRAIAGGDDGSLPELVERYRQTAGGSVPADVFLKLDDSISSLMRFREECLSWAEDYGETLLQLPLARRRGEEILHGIGEAVDRAEGRQRLRRAIQVRSFKRNGGAERQKLAESIIMDLTLETDLSLIRRNVADLALLRERLHSMEDADNLADLKDNEFMTLLARLRRHSVFLFHGSEQDDLQQLVNKLLNDFESAVFGSGYQVDNDHQTIVTGVGGEYPLSLSLLNLRKDRVRLQNRANAIFGTFKNAVLQVASDTELHARQEMGRVERALTGAWSNMLLVGIITGVIFMLLSIRILRAIKRQITAIETSNIQLDTRTRELRKSKARLQRLSSDLIHVQENERRRISLELHDELGQSLAAMKMHVNAMGRKIGTASPAELSHECEEIRDTITGIIENVRRLSRDLSPLVLEELSLASAIEFLVNNFSKVSTMQVTLEQDDISHYFNDKAQRSIYRILQESLTNISKHARASQVAVAVEKQENSVTFSVLDNGCGFEMRQALRREIDEERGMGLAAMYERARILGGNLHIRSKPGQGTAIVLTVPLVYKEEDDDSMAHSVGR